MLSQLSPYCFIKFHPAVTAWSVHGQTSKLRNHIIKYETFTFERDKNKKKHIIYLLKVYFPH